MSIFKKLSIVLYSVLGIRNLDIFF